MKYYIIGDEDAVLGFGMVGVQGSVVSSPEEAERAFRSALGCGREERDNVVLQQLPQS